MHATAAGWPICVLSQDVYWNNNTLAYADDDTWVNMPRMQSLLAHYNETHPFALGVLIQIPMDVVTGQALSWHRGGAGIFMSQVSPLTVGCPHRASLTMACMFAC